MVKSIRENDLQTVRIRAVVKVDALQEQLRRVGVVKSALDGAGLAAQVITRRDRDQDGAALLQKALDGFPANILSWKVKRREVSSEGLLEAMVVCSVNNEAYSQLAAKLKTTLEQMAQQRGTGWLGLRSNSGTVHYSVGMPKTAQQVFNDTMQKTKDANSVPRCVLLLGRSVNRRKWHTGDLAAVADWYLVQGPAAKIPEEIWRRTANAQLLCSLKDMDGKEIAVELLTPFRNRDELVNTPGGLTRSDEWEHSLGLSYALEGLGGRFPGPVLIMPVLLDHCGVREESDFPVRFQLEASQLARVRGLEVELRLPEAE